MTSPIRPDRVFEFTVEKAPAGVTGRLIVSPDLPYFEGHFPGHPVLPAVGLLDATERLISLASGREVRLVSIDSAKFLGVVTPGMEVRIELSSPNSASGPPGEDVWLAVWKDEAPPEARLSELRVRVVSREIGH